MAIRSAPIDMALDDLRSGPEYPHALLGLCAQYRPTDIPLSLLTVAVSDPHVDASEMPKIRRMAWLGDLGRIRAAIAEAAARGLVSKSATSLSIHEAVAARVRQRATPAETSAWIDSAALLLTIACPVDPTDSASWPVMRHLAPHVFELIRRAVGKDIAADALGELGAHTGRYLLLDGFAAEANELCTSALMIGIVRPDIDESLRNVLAASYGALGRPYDALEVLEPLILAARTGKSSLSANTATNYGTVLFRVGRLDEAAEYLRKAVHMWTDLGVMVELANAAANLGLVLRDLRLLEEAEDTLRHAISLREEILSSGRTGGEYAIADDYGNLATVLHELGDLDGALAMHRHSLEAHTQTLRHEHPAIGRDLANLANVLAAMGRIEEATSYYVAALEIFDRELGTDHEHTARVREHLAELRRKAP